MLSRDEKRFRDNFGHASTCNCIRQFRGKTIINTMRKCDCGFVKSDVDAYRAAVKALVEKIKLFDDTAVSERSINFAYYQTKKQWLELKQALAAVERLEVFK